MKRRKKRAESNAFSLQRWRRQDVWRRIYVKNMLYTNFSNHSTWIIFQNFEKFIKFHEKIEVDFLNSRFILGGSITSIYNTENSPYKFQWYTLIHLIYILSIISNQKKYSAFRLNMHFFTRPDPVKNNCMFRQNALYLSKL